MAIKTVPKISGPSYGGTIYGLNLSIGYAQEPSKLTLNIVNKDGNYTPPSVGGSNKVTVSFGSFKFVGIPWSYSLNESAAEKTLQVELIDGSVILDRYYVLLWKRGFFGNMGSDFSQTKNFDLTDIEYLVPILQNGRINFRKDNLGLVNIASTSRKASGKSGNILYIGTEEFKDSECTVPGTYYTLDQLKDVSPIDINFTVPTNYRGTHEGPLREVISQWCNEAGYEFYWDFNTDNIKYYKSSDGLANISDISTNSNSSIIQKTTTESAEGTFTQVAFSYVIYPKEPVKSLSGSTKFSIVVGINPYSIGYFFNKNGTASSITDRESWGKRNTDEMLTAGFLGYINQSLRNIWALYEGYYFACGYNTSNEKKLSATQKTTAINSLKSSGHIENIKALETLDAEGLPNYDFYFADFDTGWLNTFQQIEQEAIQFLGKYYQHAGKSGKFFYCSNTSVIEINVSVTPEASYIEELTDGNDFVGRKLFIRQGSMTHDSQSAAEALGLNEELVGKIESLQPWHYEFANGELQGLTTDRNVLALIPKRSLVDKILTKFSINFKGAIQNGKETTVQDLLNQSSNDIENNCGPFDEAYKKGSCISAREQAEQIARERKIPKQRPEKELVDGLSGRSCKGVDVNLGSGRLQLGGPSDAQYQVVYNYTINATFLYNGEIETIKFNGTGVSADNVSRIEVIEDNVTDPSFDDFGKPRSTDLPKAVNIVNTNKQKTIQYVFAGEPSGLTMSPTAGLSALDISLSDDGFKTTVTFSTRPPRRTPIDSFLRKVNSQINRSSINAT